MKQDRQSQSRRLRLKPLSVLFVALLIGFCIDANNTADAEEAEEHVRLLNKNSSKYLAVGGADVRDGANVIIWEDMGQKDIWWDLKPQPQDKDCYKIQNRNSGKYLAVSGASITNGGNVIQWHDAGQPDILWDFERVGSSCYKIRNVNSGKYLAVAGAAVTNGGNVIQWEDVNQPDIVWCKEHKK